MDIQLVLVLVVVFALLFDLSNGWNDAANTIATAVSTRVLSPAAAVVFGAALNFAGAMFSSEVAKTVGRDIADPGMLSGATFLTAVIVAPAWISLCTLRGLPVSCSHSVMGGLVGSVMASAGTDALKAAGVRKIVIGVFTSPVLGFAAGMLVVVAVAWTCRRMRPALVSAVFGKLQILSSGYMAFAHGTGDAQKAMGIITGALVSAGMVEGASPGEFHIPLWVRLACASAMGVGTAVGGWAVMKTLGSRLTHLQTYQGFAAEMGGATTIIANTLTGVPISTTHSITGSIMGVGAARNLRSVRWGIGRKIVYAWVLTFPACIGGGAACYWLLRAAGVD